MFEQAQYSWNDMGIFNVLDRHSKASAITSHHVKRFHSLIFILLFEAEEYGFTQNEKDRDHNAIIALTKTTYQHLRAMFVA